MLACVCVYAECPIDYVHSECLWPCCMSMSMLHVHVHAACPCPCLISHHYSCFASKVVSFSSIETSKLAVSLFRETTEINLFVSDSVETSFGLVSVLSIWTEFRRTPFPNVSKKHNFCGIFKTTSQKAGEYISSLDCLVTKAKSLPSLQKLCTVWAFLSRRMSLHMWMCTGMRYGR